MHKISRESVQHNLLTCCGVVDTSLLCKQWTIHGV